MKRSSLETIVLIVGVIVIAIALFFMFGRSDENPTQSLFITNLVFSFGFLIYIIYSIMATNSLNREIRGLNKHIEGLKHEISKYKKQLAEKDAEIAEQQKDLLDKEEVITSQNQRIETLEKKVSELENPETPS